MRPNNGRKLRARKSNGGEPRLCVPPVMRTRLSPLAVSNAGSTVWNTSVQLPAVPIANE